MLIFYGYLMFILLLAVLYLYAIRLSFCVPIKIKVLSICISAGMIFRYTILVIMFISQNIKGLYIFKFLYFVNILLIPMIGCIAIYVFMRNEKVKFNIIFIIFTILIFFYIFATCKFNIKVEINSTYGYDMCFLNKHLIDRVYILINTIFLILSIYMLDNKNVIKIGLVFILISSAITIIEMFMPELGIILLPSNIIGDLLWTISFVYALNKVKK